MTTLGQCPVPSELWTNDRTVCPPVRARSESVKEKCSLSPGARRELGTYCKTSEYNNNDSAHAWTSVYNQCVYSYWVYGDKNLEKGGFYNIIIQYLSDYSCCV